MKVLLSLLFLFVQETLFSQESVTKFLGIPIDGSKSSMIQKIKAKGFKYDPVSDRFEGQFNGYDVLVSLVTYNNKVYRVFLRDKYYCSESSIRLRFNKLCRQFESNKKYISANFLGDPKISEDEDISYEMTVNSKRYDASFFSSIRKF